MNKRKFKIRQGIKQKVKTVSPPWVINFLKRFLFYSQRIIVVFYTIYGKALGTRIHLKRNKNKPHRFLEIGSGLNRIPGFETLNIIGIANVDYVLDASKKLPFQDCTFDLIYASHILEHIPWYKTREVLKEWFRILKSGGSLEIWVPDGLKICKILIESEKGSLKTIPDNWDLLNKKKDPFLWVNGRLFYGARLDYPSWHKALFTLKYLKRLLNDIGFTNIKEMDNSEVRGYDHGWVNLGVKGKKP